MPLVVCEDVRGEADISRQAPEVHHLDDALLIPFGQADKPGVYRPDGALFGPAAYFRGLPSPHFPLEDQQTPFDAQVADYAPDDTRYLFAGHLTGHFGHFLFSVLARLWALPQPPPDLKLVLLNGALAPTMSYFEFARTLFAALGISQDSFATFDRPVRLRRLMVPAPAIEENRGGHVQFAEFCHRIGASLLGEGGREESDSLVYLTKRRLPSGVYRIVNEDAFCAELERLGVEVVSPEALSLRDQIALWAGRRVVAGMSGSMLHTSVFVPGRRYVALNVEPWRNSNQLIFDRINGNVATTLHPRLGLAALGASQSFHHNFRLTDPQRTARGFFRAMARARDEAARGPRRALAGRSG